MSDLDATNYNRNYLFWGVTSSTTVTGQAPDPGYVVRNSTLVAGELRRRRPAPARTESTTRSRARTKRQPRTTPVSTASYRFSDAFKLSGQIGTSEGHGETPTQDVSETRYAGRHRRRATSSMASAARPTSTSARADTSTPVPGGNPVVFGWIFGAQFVDVEDQENWAQIDADFAIDSGAWTGLQFGVRYNEHERESLNAVDQGPLGRRPSGPGELSDDVPELPVRLQHLRRVVPDGHLVLVAVAACDL